MPRSPERAPGGASPPARAELPAATDRVLRAGRAGKAELLLVRSATGPLVVKDFAGRSRLFAHTLGRWLCAREVRAYRRLAGEPRVPRFAGAVDAFAFAIEYRPGEPLGRALRERLPASFVDELAASIDALHARGVLHLDLSHRSNVLADADGRPVIVDFASAICVDPGRPFGRWLVRWLGRADRRALAKWRAKLAPAQLDRSTAGFAAAVAAPPASAPARPTTSTGS